VAAATLPSVQTYQDAIVDALGGGADLRAIVEAHWLIQSVRLGGDGYRTYLETQLALVRREIGTLDEHLSYPVEGDLAARERTRLDALRLLLSATQSALADATASASSSAPVAGVMTKVAPIASPTGWPDANASRYTGDPYWWRVCP
jgi:hypothetical protein